MTEISVYDFPPVTGVEGCLYGSLHYEWQKVLLKLCVCVIKENCQYQSATNQCVLHEKQLHSEKVTVCGVSAQGILGPYFFTDDRIHNGDQCWVGCWNAVHILVLLDGMAAVYRGHMDSARCLNIHTACISLAVLRNLFTSCLVWRFCNVFSARSWDLTPPDLFLGGF